MADLTASMRTMMAAKKARTDALRVAAAAAEPGVDAAALVTATPAAALLLIGTPADPPALLKEGVTKAVVELIIGSKLPQSPADPPVIVRRADGQYLLDYGHPTNLDGRGRAEVTAITRLSHLGRPMFEVMVEHCTGKSSSSAKHCGQECNLAARVIFALGLADVAPADLPVDLFARIEEYERNRRGKELTRSQIVQIDQVKPMFRLLGLCPQVDLTIAKVSKSGRAAWSMGEDGAIIPAANEIFGDADQMALVKRCSIEIRKTAARLAQFQCYLETSDPGVPGPSSPELLVTAAFMRSIHPIRPLTPPELRKRYLEKWPVIERLGWFEVARLAFPTAHDMLPFITMMALQSRHNASVIAMYRVDTYEPAVIERDRGGEVPSEARLRAAPYKPRSHRNQPVDFPVARYPEDPASIDAFVKEWTSHLRPKAEGNASYLFIFAPMGPWLMVNSFAQLSCEIFARELKAFCILHGLKHITPKMLRPAGIDMIHEHSGGDPMTMLAAGNWRQIETGEKHYFGAPARRRDRESLSWALHVEDRRRDCGISVAGRPMGSDLLSATDGWRCANPLDSPDGDRTGQLCASHGLCPICPHGDIDTADPAWSLARTVALAVRIEEMLENAPSEATRLRFAPVLDELLEIWLPMFPPPVVAAARALPEMKIEELIYVLK